MNKEAAFEERQIFIRLLEQEVRLHLSKSLSTEISLDK
jgi:hypothetical protein